MRQLEYQCPACEDVVIVPEPGFMRGHDICLKCSYSGTETDVAGAPPRYIGSQYLVFVDYHEPPTLVWEGSD